MQVLGNNSLATNEQINNKPFYSESVGGDRTSSEFCEDRSIIF